MAAMGPCQNCGQELLFWVELKVAPVGTPQKCTPFPPSSSGRESIPAAHPSRPRERSRSRPRSDRKTGGRGRQQALPNNAGLHCVGSRVHGMTGQTVTNRDSVGDAAWGTIVRDGNLVTTNNFRVAPAPEAEVPITGATAAPSGPVADQRLEIAAQGFDVVSERPLYLSHARRPYAGSAWPRKYCTNNWSYAKRYFKYLVMILRHTAEEWGFDIGANGYLLVKQVCTVWPFNTLDPVRDPRFRANSRVRSCMLHLMQLIKEQTQADPWKIRFKIVGQPGREGPEYFVRAENGHSMTTVTEDGLGLVRLTPDQVPVFLAHGTDADKVTSIATDGLKVGGGVGNRRRRNRGRRNHIHFVDMQPGDSPHRWIQAKEVLTFWEARKAANAGFGFARAGNGVILCNQNIPPRFFTGAKVKRSGRWIRDRVFRTLQGLRNGRT